MKKALLAKFTQHKDLKLNLLATGDALLVENTKRDKYWGDGGDEGTGVKGQNKLGKFLMELREQLKE